MIKTVLEEIRRIKDFNTIIYLCHLKRMPDGSRVKYIMNSGHLKNMRYDELAEYLDRAVVETDSYYDQVDDLDVIFITFI